jgi:predicted dehydrogenase
MQRRTFLMGAAAARLSAQPARLRIGFLGATHPHGPEKLRQMQTSTDFEFAGLAEKDAKAADAAARRGVSVVPRERLLADSTVPVIAVESDVNDHVADALAALDAGKHVHLEKAPAADMPSFRKVVDLAARKGLLLQTGYMWRYNPAINAALDAAGQGWLGDVYLVRGSINTLLGPEARRPVAAFTGGGMFELAGHLIDPMVRLMGRPAGVTPYIRRHGAYPDQMSDNTLAVLEWPRALGIIGSAALQPGAGAHRTFEILGTKGTAVVRPIEPPVLLLDLAAGKRTPPMPEYRRFVDDFRDLASAIRQGRGLKVTAAEELTVQETLLRASGMPAS